MARGSLRIYLGASPGVGKTYAMLNEGVRRAQRGSDVVIGVVETHGRTQTAAQIAGLEIVPRRRVEYRDTVIEEMDVAAVLARRPQIVLVDEYAHTNAPGSANDKRWQDVEMLLDGGIDVISTLNIQHLESLNDVVGRITGVIQRETVPDAVVRRADQIELVDMSPEALRRRMAHGNIYPAERVDAALTNYFRPGNLGALRELALLWVADRVEESLTAYLGDHGIVDAWETRERVVVGLTGAPDGDAIVRRAARIAGRVGGELIGVHVSGTDGLHDVDAPALDAQRRLVEELGGRVRDVVGADPADALVAFARTEKATQIVLGASRRSRWYEIWHGSFVSRVTRGARGIDVHVIGRGASGESTPRHPSGRSTRAISVQRLVVAWALTIVVLPVMAVVTAQFDDAIQLETELLLALTLVLAISAIGGRLVAFVAAIAASLLVNWFFVEPRHTFTIAEPENVIALVVFVAVAITVGSLVDLASQRTLDARRARTEASALARAAATVAADPDPLPRLVEQIATTFAATGVELRTRAGGTWNVLASTGDTTASPDDRTAEFSFGPDEGFRMTLLGARLTADDRRVVRALLDPIVVAVEARALVDEAREVEALTAMDAVRTALLRAVSHDLRTPLATIKALVSGLLEEDVAWSHDDAREALRTVEDATDRLDGVVGNLLDASRLQIGALAVHLAPVDVLEVVTAAADSVGTDGEIVIEVDPGLPRAMADHALLERSLANIMSNALRHASGSPTRITAGCVNGQVVVCVIDRGPGIPADARSQVMAPFQRLGDASASIEGIGLGLSIAQGFTEAMGGTVTLDDTPGGGLTVTVTVPMAPGDMMDTVPEREVT